jgi:nucleotide-binding universal stress UspA family protein
MQNLSKAELPRAMKPEKILLPVDVTQCPLEALDLVNGLASRPEVTVILLHVVNLNIVAPENRVYDELEREARWHLERLADRYIVPLASTLTHVRTGNLADEILAEASAERADLIIMPSYGPSFWDRLRAVWKPSTGSIVSPLAEKIIRQAPCGVFVAPAKTRVNCERVWGRPVEHIRLQRQTQLVPAFGR